jgi:hypothetical protein
MPNARLVQTRHFNHHRFAQLSLSAEYLYHACWPHLDREGRCLGDPAWVRGMAGVRARAERWTDRDVAALMLEWPLTLGFNGAPDPLVLLYEAEGLSVCQFQSFVGTQLASRLERESPSTLPAPPDDLVLELVRAPATVDVASIVPARIIEIADQENHPLSDLKKPALSEMVPQEKLREAGKQASSRSELRGSPPPRSSSSQQAASTQDALTQPALDADLDPVVMSAFARLEGADSTTLDILRDLRRRGATEAHFAGAFERLRSRRPRHPARYFTSVIADELAIALAAEASAGA